MLCEPRSFVSAMRRTGCVSINDRSAFETEIRLVRISAESDRPRRDLRQCLGRIDDRDVVRGLIFKNAQLGRAIFCDRAIAIEMVGREIQARRLIDGRKVRMVSS